MRIIFQIFTGDLTPESQADVTGILQKLTKAHEADRLAGVLCGWSTDAEFYRPILETLHNWQLPVYLKLPVFSELSGCDGFDPLISYNDQPAEPYVLNPQESFLFRCPQSSHNRRVLLDLYEQHFAHLPFDGIFLDRVRYPSFLSGVAGIGGCFCPDCISRYEKAGISVSEVRQRLRLWQEGQIPKLIGYDGGRWKLNDPVLDHLFEVKGWIIEDAVEELTTYFHQRGLQVGLDLLTPALGYFCGQNVQRLRQTADFVKPMMYRFTDAPAGLPFERQMLVQALGAEAFDTLAGESSEALMRQELTWMRQEAGCPIWPGVEANHIEPIAPITPDQIRENRKLLEVLGYEQMVASWNLDKVPADNLEALLS